MRDSQVTRESSFLRTPKTDLLARIVEQLPVQIMKLRRRRGGDVQPQAQAFALMSGNRQAFSVARAQIVPLWE